MALISIMAVYRSIVGDYDLVEVISEEGFKSPRLRNATSVVCFGRSILLYKIVCGGTLQGPPVRHA